MELIYLWLNNYKCLKDFGVILNAAYEEETKKYSDVLKQTVICLKEKSDYLNIFPKNINVTTLVGGNGSGKSNIVTALNKIIHSICSVHSSLKPADNYDDTPMPKEYCLILKQENSYIAYCSDINAFKLTITTKENNKYNAIYSDQYKDLNRDIPFEKRRIVQAKNKKISSAMFQPFLRKEEDYQNNFPVRNNIYGILRTKLKNYFYYDRFRLYDAVRTIQELYKFNDTLLKDNCLEVFKRYPHLYFDEYTPYLNIYAGLQWTNQKIQDLNEEHPLKNSISHSVRMYCGSISKYNSIEKIQDDLLPKLFFYYAFGEILAIKNKSYKEGLFHTNYDIVLNKLPSDHIPNKDERLDFYTDILKLNIPNTLRDMLTAYQEYEEETHKKNRLSLKGYLNKYYEIVCDNSTNNLPILRLKKLVPFTTIKRYPLYVTQIERLKCISKNLYKNSSDGKIYDFLSLSTGEQRILRFFADIYLAANIKNLKNRPKEPENNLFIFDEMDLSWHPEWQRNMVYYILDIFRKIIFCNKNILNNTNRTINIIFTTHSPFILSDMPKDNIIMLYRDRDGLAKKYNSEENTFGANIHDLFNNNFFFNDCDGICTMGEFVKDYISKLQGEIQSIIKDIENVENSDLKQNKKTEKINNKIFKLEQKIQIIGEPIIRTTLLSKLYSHSTVQIYKNPEKLLIENFYLREQLEKLRSKHNEET